MIRSCRHLTSSAPPPLILKAKVGCKGSLWPSNFEEPINSKQEIAEIRGTREYERKVNVPIKAALKDESCSMFRHPLITRFFNIVVEHSNGQLNEVIMLNTCRRIKEIQLKKYLASSEERRAKIERNPMVIILGAIENCRPLMRLEKVKVGSVTYFVPTPITERKSYMESMRWLHQMGRWERDESAADRIIPNSHKPVTPEKLKIRPDLKPSPKITIADGLAKELVDAYNLVGRAINKKYEHHKLCEQNRAYAHYRRTK